MTHGNGRMVQWLLIDGNSWFAADYYASSGRAHDSFLKRLATFEGQFKFDRLAVAWDSRSSFRRDLLPTYKTHRGAKPEGFEITLAKVKQMVAELGHECLEAEGFEGDDILATLAQVALDEGVQAVICSADKDLHQCLVAGQVSQITAWKRATHDRMMVSTMTAAGLVTRYGVQPHQWVDYRVIVGDPSDGIAGCHGLGAETAKRILVRCGDLDRFYASPFAAGLPSRQHQKMLAHRDQVPILRQVLALRRDVPIPSRWYAGVA